MEKAPATISAVIPTFNRGHCIGRAIESALAQAQPPSEIIVVDDGSTDDTADVLRRFGDRIRVIKQENAGVSAARNTGVAASRGDRIAFLDSDDEWCPEKLAVQADSIRRHPDAVLHACNGLVFSEHHAKGVDLFAERECREFQPEGSLVDRPLWVALDTLLMTPGIVVRRDAFERAGGFDTRFAMFEDLDLLVRLACQGPWAVTSQCLFRVYRRGGDTASLSDRHARCGDGYRNLILILQKALDTLPLTRDEALTVRKQLSSYRAKQAVGHDRSTGSSIAGLLRSVRDCPGATSLCRALAGSFAGEPGIEWLHRLRHGRDDRLPLR